MILNFVAFSNSSRQDLELSFVLLQASSVVEVLTSEVNDEPKEEQTNEDHCCSQLPPVQKKD